MTATTHHIRIEQANSRPGAASIVVDGIDISNTTRAVDVHMDAESIPHVVVDTIPLGGISIDLETAEVVRRLHPIEVDAMRNALATMTYLVMTECDPDTKYMPAIGSALEALGMDPGLGNPDALTEHFTIG